jgi:hypothetical protein
MRLFILGSLLAVSLGASVSADQIPLGLSWDQKVFVQEYWRLGSPYYAVSNRTDKVATLTLIGNKGQIGGPWRVKSGATKGFQVPTADNLNELVRVMNGDRSLGLIDLPTKLTPPAEDGFATCVGLNGSGGRDQNLWMVQKQWQYVAGGVIEVTFLIKSRPGTLSLTGPAGDTRPGGLAGAQVKKATSETLPVQEKGKGFVIDTGKPKKPADWHRVTVQLQAPEVKTLTLVLINGWMADSGGGGHVLARGVLVAPKRD